MTKHGTQVPVVVVEGSLNSLGVVRSLAVGGMPIYLLSTSRSCATAWSRLCRFIRVPSLEGTAFIDSLVELGTKFKIRPVLILTGDQCVDAVSARRDVIEPLYRISLPSMEIVRTLADKALFQGLAQRQGFPIPDGIILNEASDLQLLQEMAFPVIIKPADKKLVLNNLVERAVKANSLPEARTACAYMLRNAPSVIVQEWISGPDAEIFFSLFTCDGNGKLIGLFSGRKLVCSPPSIGNTAVCVAAPEVSGELSKLVSQFIESVGYRGLGSLEFKRIARTGQFVIIEPTVGRTDWQEEVATLCGINLPLITYCSELGLPLVAPNGHSRPIAWRSTIEHRIPGNTLRPGTAVIDGFFRISDPLPAFYYYLFDRLMVRALRKVARSFRSRAKNPRRRLDD